MIAHATIDGPEATRTAWILHGILGSGRNWRSFARALRKQDPSWRYVLPDLRNHGDTGPVPGPHTLTECAADLQHLPAPDRVIGHSFGGKVALEWACSVGTAQDVWVLDSIPVSTSAESDNEVMTVLSALHATVTPAAERSDVREVLTLAGIPKTLVDWLLTSLRRTEDGWRWMYGLDGIEAMMSAYFSTDYSAFLSNHDGPPIHLVRAMNSDRWTEDVLKRLACGPSVTLHAFPDAGHWLHVDQPAALRDLLLA